MVDCVQEQQVLAQSSACMEGPVLAAVALDFGSPASSAGVTLLCVPPCTVPNTWSAPATAPTHPQVHSNGFHFAFDLSEPDALGYVLPSSVPPLGEQAACQIMNVHYGARPRSFVATVS